jgi:diguanylate cyclase (GGDEF)-like protein
MELCIREEVMPSNKRDLDNLTGLMKRKEFGGQFKAIMGKALIEEFPFSLAFLDIDKFLDVNEEFGHLAGDTVLVMVANTIREIVDEDVFIARYGGDEFALLFSRLEREASFLTLERIRLAMEARRTYEYSEGIFDAQIRISGGVASYPVDARSENELLRKALQALYRAKEMGGNQIRLAYEERLVPKTTHYTATQLERLSKLAQKSGDTEAELLREALDDLLNKYWLNEIPIRPVDV